MNGDEFQVAQPIHLERTSFYYGDWDLFVSNNSLLN